MADIQFGEDACSKTMYVCLWLASNVNELSNLTRNVHRFTFPFVFEFLCFTMANIIKERYMCKADYLQCTPSCISQDNNISSHRKARCSKIYYYKSNSLTKKSGTVFYTNLEPIIFQTYNPNNKTQQTTISKYLGILNLRNFTGIPMECVYVLYCAVYIVCYTMLHIRV
jgi:hypothetical protein